MVTGVIGGAIIALIPLVVRDVLHGGARIYGVMLSAFGLGAVIGAVSLTGERRRMSGEAAIRACALSMGGAIAAVALSHEPVVTAAALVLAGAVWMMAWVLFSIGVQLSAPRWVAGRSLAAYQAAGSGGVAVGSWGWGHLTDVAGVDIALLISAALMLISPLLGFWLPMPRVAEQREEAEMLEEPKALLGSTGRSGPMWWRSNPSRARQCARLSQIDAGRPTFSPTQRRLWLVDCLRHRRSRALDRALSLPDMARLSSPAQPLDKSGASTG